MITLKYKVDGASFVFRMRNGWTDNEMEIRVHRLRQLVFGGSATAEDEIVRYELKIQNEEIREDHIHTLNQWMENAEFIRAYRENVLNKVRRQNRGQPGNQGLGVNSG